MSTQTLTPRRVRRVILQGYLPLIVATACIVLPLLWMVLSSFKLPTGIISTPLQWLPHHLYLGNYQDAGRQVPFARDFVNSAIVTIVGAGIKVVLSLFTAYGLVFCRFPGKSLIFLVILGTMMVPGEISILPNYALIAGLGGLNTYWGIILPGLGSGFGTFLLRQQLLAIPSSIVEAASIDGAGHWVKLWRVVAPISTPTIITVALICIVGEWNAYLWPLIITDDPKMMTLPVGLSLLQDVEGGSISWGVLMAGSLIVILPILLVFAVLQRHIVSGFTQGAVKG